MNHHEPAERRVLLSRQEWMRLVFMMFLFSAVQAVALLGVSYVSHRTLRWTTVALTSLPGMFALFMGVYRQMLIQRKGAVRGRQFGIGMMLLIVSLIGVWLAILQHEIRQSRNRDAVRRQLEVDLEKLVGGGQVRLSQGAFIKVNRTTFNDDDLRRVLRYQSLMKSIDASIYALDLSNTQITDAGIAELTDCRRLEFLYLNQTSVTERGVRKIAGLPRLQFVALRNTQVTAAEIEQLRNEHPRLQIEPYDQGVAKPLVSASKTQ